MTSFRFFLLAGCGTGLALASDLDLSGNYKDVSGHSLRLLHSGSDLSVKPDPSKMPEQVKRFAQGLELKGTVTTKAQSEFAMQAEYSETLTPAPNTKLKVQITFKASGTPSSAGLAMETCRWNISAIAFAGGEIAGSESQERKCVGLWEKVP